MSTIERVKKVIDWLVFTGVIDGQNDLAERIGYSKSYMSQVCNGGKSINDAFLGKLCSLDDNISRDWLINGEGGMFLINPLTSLTPPNIDSEQTSTNKKCNAKIVDAEAWEIIKNQSRSILSMDKQVEYLIGLLKNSMNDSSDSNFKKEHHADCADVV